jgi:phosphohistidine swiveling domain-containing protein
MNKRYNSEEWYVWEQNASPMLLIMTLNPSFQNLREYLGSCLFNTLVVFETDNEKNYQAKWIFRLDEGRILGQKMVDFLLCPSYMVAFSSGIEVSEERLIKKAEEILKNAHQYSLENIPDIFSEFCNLYYDYYKLAAFTEPVQWHTEHLITNYITKHYKGDVPINDAIKALLTTEEDSFVVDILRDLLECAKMFDIVLERDDELRTFINSLKIDSSFAEVVADKVFQMKTPNIDGLLAKLNAHSQKYHWKRNNYFSTSFVSAKDVLIEIIDPNHFKMSNTSAYYNDLININRASKTKHLQEKEKVFGELPSYYQNIISIANAIGSTLIDRRKKNVMVCNSSFDALFKIVSEKIGFSIDDIHLLIPQELSHFIADPSSYKERFEQRRKLFVCLQSDFPLVDELIDMVDASSPETIMSWKVSPTTDPFIAEGNVAEKALEKLNLCMNLFESSGIVNNALHGITSFYDEKEPCIEGIARIIKNPKTESLEVGEILVTPSTTPDFINAINKSKAIITDWGGQTSHAAIVSRELKKPCIIGTNYASQLIKSGQKIRIDFLTGSIQIIK